MPLLGRHLGLLIAVLIAGTTVGVQYLAHRDQIAGWDRKELPAFDAYAYVAMAKHPAFFTLPPWGYRVLTPWLVRLVPGTGAVRAYRYLTLGGLALAGSLLFLFLRRLGHGEAAALLAVAVFGLSAPVSAAVESAFLGEPVAIALQIGFLLALEAGAPLSALGLILALGAGTKELFLLFPPLVYLARYPALGHRRALGAMVQVAVPPLVVMAALRFWWAPGLHTQHPPLTLALARQATEMLFGSSWSDTWPALVLGGLTPLALLGMLRRSARPYLVRYGWLIPATIGLALCAWINIPGPQPVILFDGNVLRLMIYALPVLLAFALFALDRLLPHVTPPPAPLQYGWRVRWTLGLVLALVLAFPFAALDRYRRVEFRPVRDGPLVLALCHESLRAAAALEAGREVRFEVGEPGYVPGADQSYETLRVHWSLWSGWEPAEGAVLMNARTAVLLLPSFDSGARVLGLRLAGEPGQILRVSVNGTETGTLVLEPAAADLEIAIPAGLLFRGDNLVTLTRADGALAPRLSRIVVRPA